MFLTDLPSLIKVQFKNKSVKDGTGSVIVWACLAANVTGSLVCIDDVTVDKSNRMNS